MRGLGRFGLGCLDGFEGFGRGFVERFGKGLRREPFDFFEGCFEDVPLFEREADELVRFLVPPVPVVALTPRLPEVSAVPRDFDDGARALPDCFGAFFELPALERSDLGFEVFVFFREGSRCLGPAFERPARGLVEARGFEGFFFKGCSFHDGGSSTQSM